MKKYFVKYLRVDGDVKEGDMYVSHLSEPPQRMGPINFWSFPLYKVRPYLCSGELEIDVDDEFLHETLATKTKHTCTERPSEQCVIGDDNINYFKGFCYKIVGEISPRADWVKDDDEFDEDEINILSECPNYNRKHMWKDCSCKMGFVNGVYLKDSTGHFK